MTLELTRDRFLGGRIVADQPKSGFRAGHDTVILAAAVTVGASDRALELGSGAGIASLCLGWRVPGLEVTGVEIDPDLAKVANGNAALNGMADRVRFAAGDIAVFGPEMDGGRFDQVFLNPPFHSDTGQVSPIASRDRATRGPDLAAWFRRALELATAEGVITAVIRADRLGEVEDAVKSGTALSVFPLFPHAGEAAKRVLLRIAKGRQEERRTLPGLVLHGPDGRNTDEAEAVLRHAAALRLD